MWIIIFKLNSWWELNDKMSLKWGGAAFPDNGMIMERWLWTMEDYAEVSVTWLLKWSKTWK